MQEFFSLRIVSYPIHYAPSFSSKIESWGYMFFFLSAYAAKERERETVVVYVFLAERKKSVIKTLLGTNSYISFYPNILPAVPFFMCMCVFDRDFARSRLE